MVKQAKKPGLYADGAGLFPQVSKGVDGKPRKSWLVRVRIPGGRVREMGLGPVATVDLAKACAKAEEARQLATDGVDPIVHRETERKRLARATSFQQAAEKYIETHEDSWRNEKHRKQWRATLETYVYPVFGATPVQEIDIDHVLKVLDPIWRTKTETASRLRGRIETVLDWAAVRGLRDGENPARWRGHLQWALPPRSKVQKVEHHKALPYAELPAFMGKLRKQTGMSALALEFTILTAARTNEVLGARWNELDLVERVWTIPAERMKAGREHRVPLTGRSLEIAHEMDGMLLSGEWLFRAVRREGRFQAWRS